MKSNQHKNRKCKNVTGDTDRYNVMIIPHVYGGGFKQDQKGIMTS